MLISVSVLRKAKSSDYLDRNLIHSSIIYRNGAGKTSLINMITGLYKPEDGNAWISGFDILNN
ncbi:MAG: ATP-binding cassette domain-containing protein, partial [bacterium]